MVQIVGLEGILSEHPFARDLPPEVLQTIAGCCSNAAYHPGDYIFREGEPADHFFMIRQGLVALEIHVPQGPPIVVETLETGEIFGWGWLVPPYKWTNDARASEQVRLLKLDGACLRGKMEVDRALGYEIYKRFLPIMAKRLATTRLRIVELATEPPVHPRHKG
jgi:CRP/FNR family cyclic AMP-dependent transcriptional regulator